VLGSSLLESWLCGWLLLDELLDELLLDDEPELLDELLLDSSRAVLHIPNWTTSNRPASGHHRAQPGVPLGTTPFLCQR